MNNNKYNIWQMSSVKTKSSGCNVKKFLSGILFFFLHWNENDEECSSLHGIDIPKYAAYQIIKASI